MTVLFLWSRPRCHGFGLPTGGGGAEGVGCYPWRLCRSGPLRRPFHLWQRWPEEGYHLFAVWRLQEKVQVAPVVTGCNRSQFYFFPIVWFVAPSEQLHMITSTESAVRMCLLIITARRTNVLPVFCAFHVPETMAYIYKCGCSSTTCVSKCFIWQIYLCTT